VRFIIKANWRLLKGCNNTKNVGNKGREIKKMKLSLKPETSLGKWSVGLQTFFLIVIVASIILVKVLGILSFDDHWWDVTVLVFVASIIAFITGLIAVIRNKDRSILVYLSIFLGLCAILFVLLHSLFISD
jgi:hypothetical protein